MAGLLDLAMLICASVGALAFGILAAYAILRIGFAFMRPRRRPQVPVKAATGDSARFLKSSEPAAAVNSPLGTNNT